MKINIAEIQVLAQAAKDNPDDLVALNDYGMAMAPAVTLALLAQLAEADRLAGEAVRTKQDLIDYKRRVSSWMEQTTVELGHSRNKPFDQVFNELKAECERLRKLPTAWSEVYQQSEQNDQLLDRMLQLSNENEVLAKNANRYLVLRQADVDAIQNGGLFAGLVPENLVINGEDLDRQTDAVIEHQRAFAKSLLGAIAPAELPGPGEFALQAFAWLYTRDGTVPGTLDVKTALTKQDYPGYTATALYTGPVNGEPAGWAYRVKLGRVPANWRVSITEPSYSGDPGDIEVMPLYKGEPVTAEVQG